MDIKANEIESVEVIGELNDENVKILKTYGGFYMAVGLKKKSKKNPEVLAAGSHPALVAHQLCKEFNDDFKPKLCKSEAEQLPMVEEVTHKLKQVLIQQGFDAFILHKNNELQFIVSRFGLDMAKYEAEYDSQELSFKKHHINPLVKHTHFIDDLATIINDKCSELGVKDVKLEK